MSVYIDSAHIPASVQNGARTHTSTWCHMMADTTDELLAFASRIGLRPAWIQYRGTPKEHFDVTAGKRWQAVRAGAIEITSAESVALMRAKREQVPFDLDTFRSATQTDPPADQSTGAVRSAPDPLPHT